MEWILRGAANKEILVPDVPNSLGGYSFRDFIKTKESGPQIVKSSLSDTVDVKYFKATFSLLVAPCGTGKTLFAPTAVGITPAVILIPRRFAVRNATNFYIDQGHLVYSRVEGQVEGNSTIDSAEYIIMTTASFRGMWLSYKDILEKAKVFFIDEAHDMQPSLSSVIQVLKNLKTKVMFMTATPRHYTIFPFQRPNSTQIFAFRSVLREADFRKHSGKAKFEQMEYDLHNFILDRIHGAKTVMVVGGSIKNAKATFNVDFPHSVELESSSMTFFSDSKLVASFDSPDPRVLNDWIRNHKPCLIHSTPVIEVGVTIEGLDAVIDNGYRYRANVTATDLIDPVKTIRSSTGSFCFASWQEVIQAICRVGRTHDGIAILLNTEHFTPAPVDLLTMVRTNFECLSQNVTLPYDLSGLKPFSPNLLSKVRKEYLDLKSSTDRESKLKLSKADALISFSLELTALRKAGEKKKLEVDKDVAPDIILQSLFPPQVSYVYADVEADGWTSDFLKTSSDFDSFADNVSEQSFHSVASTIEEKMVENAVDSDLDVFLDNKVLFERYDLEDDTVINIYSDPTLAAVKLDNEEEDQPWLPEYDELFAETSFNSFTFPKVYSMSFILEFLKNIIMKKVKSVFRIGLEFVSLLFTKSLPKFSR
jgi:hypothetical protein